MTRFHILVLFSFFCLPFGCNRAPSELSGLVPVTVTVKEGDRPVPGVLVVLASERVGPVWASKAMTDARGKAVIGSMLRDHDAPGAPAGHYRIVISRRIDLPDELKPTQAEEDGEPPSPDMRKRREEYIRRHRIVPEKLHDYETSPIELTVEAGKPVESTVDFALYR